MVKRAAVATEELGQERSTFELPSAREHLLAVTDVLDTLSDDPDIVFAKLEVVGGDEEGRTTLCRLSLDDKAKGFFFTRFLLKAVDLPHSGEFSIDTDEWIGRQFYAKIVHKEYKGKTYANIDEFNFDKKVEQSVTQSLDDIQWDE